MKLNDKEIAYRRGQKDERQKMIDTLNMWQSNLIRDAQDENDTTKILLSIFIDSIGEKIRELESTL
jgi:hypothetical protein